jgi:cysteinyl-tRNA synthetase
MQRIYNSLTRKIELFSPIHPGHVRMYVCGITVYDFCHLGHARMMVVFDMVYRWLLATGLEVTYVRNITDVDDKIIQRAAQNNEPIDALTERMINAMHADLALLGVRNPNHEPRATQYVPGMVKMIQTLIEKGFAYPGQNGDVFYAVRKFEGYGKLSGKSLDDLRAGERVEVDTFKRDPLDFVLWKAAKPGEPSWPSPWGEGRPGWHIECSVMSEALLGPHFDIHGGGHDLQFPHHENEIAQSEAANGCTFVNHWMHNGFLRVNDEKMSKSLGNFFTIADVLKVFDPEVVRFFLLRGHYRSPLNYTDFQLEDARQALNTLYTAVREHGTLRTTSQADAIDWSNNPISARFKAAMEDDFATPECVAILFELAREANRDGDNHAVKLLFQLAGLMGFLERDPELWFKGGSGKALASNAQSSEGNQAIDDMVNARNAARKARNFPESDRIRDALLAQGITLEDGPNGTTWRRS